MKIVFGIFFSLFILFTSTKSWKIPIISNFNTFDILKNVKILSQNLFGLSAPDIVIDTKQFVPSRFDPSSFSKPEEWKITNISINWNINFKNQTIEGYVDYLVKKQVSLTSDSLVLDTRDLKIIDISNIISNKKLKYTLHPPKSFMGSKLEILMPKNIKKITIRIKYETSPNSSALKWLTPSQTAGKINPYMFSQSQPIHARSILPCQDSPAVKFTYSAKVSAPENIMVLMGAIKDKNNENGIHSFHQPIPIPSYLIAIAAGALEFRQISKRCRIWSEKELIDDAAEEFSETEKILKAGEKLMGPYLWGRYDILVLPPSFPFGGMENPCLTFTTPTLLAGDKSLTNVIAHEIAHSWTSNFLTHRNHEHFWLNEGFTVYIERKIIAELMGEKYRHFQSLLGWDDLKQAIKMFDTEIKLTQLVMDLKGVNPDRAISIIPYEKGHTFFFYLEQLVGGSTKFMPFIRAFIEEYKYMSVDTQQFIRFFISFFKHKLSSRVLSAIDWHSWLLSPGMPPKPNYDESLIEDCKLLNVRWQIATSYEQFNKNDISNMTSLQICSFISMFLQQKALPIAKISALTKIYNLNETKNMEIKSRWLQIGIRSQWEEIIPYALRFVSETGRLKFLRLIFRELYNWEAVRQQAIDTYNALKDGMIYITNNLVASDLKLN